ncbi:type IVB secretion system protein DotA [soil metagenome]
MNTRIGYWLTKFAILMAALLLPLLAFCAEDQDGSRFPLVLTPPDTDVSVFYLANIFGVVDGVLHGGGSQIMGQMFGVFNAGALVLGGIIIIYFTLVSTLNTAHEGEFLGKRWKSIWIPIRAVTGIALLIPKATGYSALQIFVMWITIQGVGLADSIWNSALTYLQGGGVIVQQALVPNKDVAIASGKLLKSETCLFALQQALRVGAQKARAKGDKNIPTIPMITLNIIPIAADSTCGVRNGPPCVSLPDFHTEDPLFQKLTGICGQVTWGKIDADVLAAKTGLSGAALKNLALSRQIAVQQILIDMSGPGQIVANNWLQLDTPIGITPPKPLAVDKILSPRLLLNTAQDYQGIELPAQRTLTKNNTVDKKFFEDAKAKGWMSAGVYYSNLVGLNVQVEGVTADVPKVDANDAMGKLKDNLTTNLPTFVTDNIPGVIPKLTAIFTDTTESSLSTYIDNAPKSDKDYGGRSDNKPKKHTLDVGSWFIKMIIQILLGFIYPLIEVFDTFDDLLHVQASGANPLVLIALMGNNMTSFVTQFWLQSSLGIGGLSLGTAFFCGMSLTSAINTFVSMLFPFLWPILGACFINGLMMSYYIPLIPFILFLFGTIGWLVAVVEAMVAAPIIALGIAYPEGQHELFGRSEQGIMMILNVFLTPAFMIIGFILGIILSYVAIWLLNFGFDTAFKSLPSTNDFFLYLFTSLARIVIYTILAIYIIQESFTPIHRLRDQILNFIGGPGSTLGAEFHRAATGAQSDTKGGAQAMSGMMEPPKGGAGSGGGDSSGGGGKASATPQEKKGGGDATLQGAADAGAAG